MTFIYHALSFRSVNQFIADYGDLRLGGFQGEANLTIPWEGRSSPFNGNAFAYLASELLKTRVTGSFSSLFQPKQLLPILRHPKPVRNSHFPRINQMSLYVSGPARRIYHIVLERGHGYTLCGLKVTTLKVILSEKPKNGVLCKHCERLKETELPNSIQE